jgi:hypothetical protein
MKGKHLFLHIGTHKTGSSSIQKVMSAKRDVLAQHGFYYPADGAYYLDSEFSQSLAAHALLKRHPSYISHIKFDQEKCLAELERDINKTTLSNIIVSSEHFSLAQTVEEMQLMHDYFYSFVDSVTVIIYLRRQDLRLESSWSQRVKTGDITLSFEAYVREHMCDPVWDYYQYLNLLTNIFGKHSVIVRPFEKDQLYGQDVVCDFMRILGLRLQGKQPVKANQSPPVEQLEVLRHYGKSIDSYRQRKAFYRLIKSLPVQWDETRYSMFTPESRAAFMSIYGASNRQVASAFLDKPDQDLFLDAMAAVPPVYPGLSMDRLAEMSKQIMLNMLYRNQEILKKGELTAQQMV